MRHRLALGCLLTFLAAAQGTADQPALAADELDKGKLALERERFAFDQKKYKRDHALERIKAYGTIASLAVPLLVGLAAYGFQLSWRRRDEILQFQLKAAEIIMDSRDTDQATRKA